MAVSADVLPPIGASGFSIGLEPVVRLPSTGNDPDTRVQQLVDAPDGRDRLFAVDTRGVVWAIDNGRLVDEPVLDLRGRPDFTANTFSDGLRSFAFHPDFQTEGAAGYGKVYTVHHAPIDSAPSGVTTFEPDPSLADRVFSSVVAEWSLEDPTDPLRVEPTSMRELFRVEQSSTAHPVAQLAFNPNAKPGDADYGNLYISLGDGSFVNDPADMAQDLGRAFGKLFRLDPLAQRDGSAYGIPEDNPFRDVAGALPEIYAYGFRNPQTFSFDTGGNGALLDRKSVV